MRPHRHPAEPAFPAFDLDFAPADYFAARDLGAALPSDVKGQARREFARNCAASGEDFPPALLAGDLDDEDRLAWGAIHPALMGGEYLPGLAAGEVEIARVAMRSVTGDVISVRARRTRGGGCTYRIVDEYDSRFDVRPRYTRAPLTLGALVAMLDRMREGGDDVLALATWLVQDGNESIETARHFLTVESDFYPQLGAYYDARIARWFGEYAAQQADEEDDDEGERSA